MKMADTRNEEELLECLFSEAREATPQPSEALMARILADAERQRSMTAASEPHGGLFRRLAATVGGWPSLAGMATAALAGVWIGYVSPGQLGGLATEFWPGADGYDLVDMVPPMDEFLAEGGA